MAVSRLRATIDTDLTAEDGHYRLELPIDAVDAWWLLDLAADATRVVSVSDLQRALNEAPFGEIDDGSLVSQAKVRCASAQSAVAQRFCDAVETMDERTASLVIEHQRAVAPFDEDLIQSIARCLHRSGKTATAAHYIDSVLEFHHAELGARAPGLVGLRASLGTARSSDPFPAPDPVDGPGRRELADDSRSRAVGRRHRKNYRPMIPSLLEHLIDEPCLGRDDEVAKLTEGRSHVLVGPLGSGKTRLLAAVAESAVANGERVSYVVADASRTAFGPFFAAFPELRADWLAELDPLGDTAAGRSSAAIRAADTRRTLLVVEHLDALAAEGRHWLLIDDIHAFDEASRRLLGFLAVAETRVPLTVVAAGRNDDGHDWSVQLTAELRRAGFGSVALGPLGPLDLESMLAAAMPHLTVAPKAELARALFERSGGLPAVARLLIGTIDPVTLTFADNVETYEPESWTQPTVDLRREVLDVGVAAAVLGHTFAVNDVMALLDRPEDEIGVALEELWDREFVVDGRDASQLRFANSLLRAAFLSKVPSFRLTKLHERAAALADDLHSKADHEAAAVPRCPPERAAESLRRSAAVSMASGSWRDAVDALRKVVEIVDTPDLETLIMLARALDLAGANGSGPRKVAFRRAVDEQEWNLAVKAALSGLPEAERPDGDPERIAMLESIPSAEIDEDNRFEQALALARQCALNGWPDRARHWSWSAKRLATNPQRHVRVQVAGWSVAHHVDPEPFHFTDEVFRSATAADRMQILQMQSITAFETDSIVAALDHHRRFVTLAAEVGDPARIWQGMVLEATLTFESGKWADAASLSAAAADFGTRHAMQQAAIVGIGQTFHQRLINREQSQLVSRFEEMPANTDASAIARAARALALAAKGQRDEAWRGVAPAVSDALARPRGSALVVLAMLAELIRHAGDPETVERVRRRLAGFADRSLIVGYGISSTGPVHRQLALLADDPDEAADHYAKAVRVADRSGSKAWQVVSRLTLARATGRTGPEREAVAIARNTELAALLPAAMRA
jgi:hypothetical protein